MKQNRRVLFALLLVFFTPGVAALLFYMNPTWLKALPTNKGSFVTPAVSFPSLDGVEDTWRIAVWCPSGCNEACLKEVDDLARVRLALGRRLYRVSLWLVQDDKSERCTPEIKKILAARDIHTRMLSAEERISLLQDEPQVILVDGKEQAVLNYTGVNIPKDVFQDLKHLLSRSEQG